MIKKMICLIILAGVIAHASATDVTNQSIPNTCSLKNTDCSLMTKHFLLPYLVTESVLLVVELHKPVLDKMIELDEKQLAIENDLRKKKKLKRFDPITTTSRHRPNQTTKIPLTKARARQNYNFKG